jgi:hypothetical protein
MLALCAQAAADAPPNGSKDAQGVPAQGGQDPGDAPAGPEGLELGLGAIKADFEKSLGTLKDPKIIQALSLRSADLALLLTLSALDPANYGAYQQERSAYLDRVWSDKKLSWEMRELRELSVYSEALSRLVVIMAGQMNDQRVLTEFVGLLGDKVTGKAKSQPAKIAEAKVYWSNRIVVHTSLLIKLIAPEKAGALEDMIDDLLNRAEVIATRRDVHYQARMDLLYLNNMQTLTGMQFLVATDKVSPISAEAATMEDSWEERIQDPDFQVSEKTSLSLVSNTQLAFPLLYWIANNKFPQKVTAGYKAAR